MWGWQAAWNLQFKVFQITRRENSLGKFIYCQDYNVIYTSFVRFLPAKRVWWRNMLVMAAHFGEGLRVGFNVNLRLAFWRNLCRQRNLFLCKSQNGELWRVGGKVESDEEHFFLCVERQPESIADKGEKNSLPSENILVNVSFGSLKNVVSVAQIFDIN